MKTQDQRECSLIERYVVLLLTLFALMVLPGSSLPVYGQAPPGNDDFVKATIIDSLPFSDTVNNSYATTQDNEPLDCGYMSRTVWYSFTPTEGGLFRADVVRIGYYETSLAVYQQTGGDLSGLAALGCQYYNSGVTFEASAGITYYIQAGGYSSEGTVQVHLSEIVPPPNDSFNDAVIITAPPFAERLDTTLATIEQGEPFPYNCASSPGATVWYSLTPEASGSISIYTEYVDSFGVFVAAYKPAESIGLLEIGCRNYGSHLTIHVDKGTTYYFQVGSVYADGKGLLDFKLEVPPPPFVSFGWSPYGEPSIFDTVEFRDYSNDPAQAGIQSQSWNFGDGLTATGCCPAHQYKADGDYTVGLTVSTFDGRTASTSQILRIMTHDVAITKFSTPSAASAGQTRAITVGVNSKRYPENVTVELVKSIPGYGYQTIGALTQSVPLRTANRTTNFSFTYTFTRDDARIGKVVFRAIAALGASRDALPGDNEATAFPTKVSR